MEPPISAPSSKKKLGRESSVHRLKEVHSGDRKFSCEICNKQFLLSSYKTQMLRHTVKGRKYRCEICSATFQLKLGLNRHVRYIHRAVTNGKHQCLSCGRRNFESIVKLEIHIRSHIQERPHFCKLCPYESPTNKGLKVHLETHDANRQRNFQGDMCSRRFLTKGYLLKHSSTHLNERKFNCATCGKSFWTLFKLKSHQRHHCLFCESRNCDSPSKLNNHIRSHILERPYFCKFCPFESPTKSNLNIHLKTHDPNRQRNFQCDLCSRKFLTKAYLLRHIPTHLNEKPNVCDSCGKSFLTSFELKVHQSVHSSERPFSCEKCGNTFKSRPGLRGHMELHKSIPKYSCMICSKQFYQQPGMRLHIQRVHTNERAYKCELCQKDFKIVRDLRNHHKRVHHAK